MVDTRCGPRDAVRRTLTSPRVVIRVRRGKKTENIYMKRPVIISFVYRFNIVLYFVSARINKGQKRRTIAASTFLQLTISIHGNGENLTRKNSYSSQLINESVATTTGQGQLALSHTLADPANTTAKRKI